MYKNQTISLIIPALNEERGLNEILPLVPSLVDEVIIVDGGSKDRTVEVAKKYKTTVILQKSQGYGSAYLEGFATAKGSIVVTADGDGTYPMESIVEMVHLLVDQNYDFVSGSRFPLTIPASMPQINFIGNLIIAVFVSFLFRVKVVDINTGMWVFRREFIGRCEFISKRWNLSPEIKIEAMMQTKTRFVEYPITYLDRQGKTKVTTPWKTGLKSLVFILAKKRQINKRSRQKQL